MKNKLIIFFVILLQIIWFNKTLSKEIEFNSSDIEIINEDNLIIANDGVATIKEDEIISAKKVIQKTEPIEYRMEYTEDEMKQIQLQQ
mgnify:CR=1 FL=1